MEISNNKICPLSMRPCKEHFCAWWHGLAEDCAVPILAGVLADSGAIDHTMDYKELIEYLRTTAACGNACYNCSRCTDAATAIESLLAEREAAIEKILKLQKNIAECSSRSKTM